MAGKAGNRVNVNVSTTGTGSPFTATTALAGGFQTLASAFNSGDIVEYAITDGSNFEDGWGVVDATQTMITRNVFDSSSSGSAINLTGAATCIITLTAQGAQAILALQAQRIGNSI
jgi:hypothetical protein